MARGSLMCREIGMEDRGPFDHPCRALVVLLQVLRSKHDAALADVLKMYDKLAPNAPLVSAKFRAKIEVCPTARKESCCLVLVPATSPLLSRNPGRCLWQWQEKATEHYADVVERNKDASKRSSASLCSELRRTHIIPVVDDVEAAVARHNANPAASAGTSVSGRPGNGPCNCTSLAYPLVTRAHGGCPLYPVPTCWQERRLH